MIAALLKPLLRPVIDKVLGLIPEPNKRREAREAMENELVGAVIAAASAQARINEIEAGHRSIFVAGWRPYIGWVCGTGLLYQFLIREILNWLLLAFYKGAVPLLPSLDATVMYNLVIALLGLSGMRMYEKVMGVSRESDPAMRRRQREEVDK